MPEPAVNQPALSGQPVVLCRSADLADGRPAHVFDLQEWGRPARGFVLRFEGRVIGYLNRCAHVPAEMDWQPGRFLDETGRWIICAIHGAVYEPTSGRCVAGPCAGRSLTPLAVGEENGQVHWYPDERLTPAFED
jgi:nitrite reductase/ring-hydroxylating ferredoxin subunit